jgi:hypothetical protein
LKIINLELILHKSKEYVLIRGSLRKGKLLAGIEFFTAVLLKSSGMLRCVDGSIVTDVSENSAFIFRI